MRVASRKLDTAEDRYVLLLAGDTQGEKMSSKSKSRKTGREKLENPPEGLRISWPKSKKNLTKISFAVVLSVVVYQRVNTNVFGR